MPVAEAAETADERQKRLLTQFNGALSRVSDGSDFDESRSYQEMVRSVSRLSDDYIHERTTQWLDWKQAVETPALVRGKFVRVRGLLGRIDTTRLQYQVDDIVDVYRCYISDADGRSEPVVVDLVDPPRVHLEEERDVVEVEGIFMRTVGFDAGKAEKDQLPLHTEAPYLVARSLEVYRSPKRGMAALSPVARWSILGGLVAVGLLAVFLMSRRSKEAARRHPALLQKPGVGIRELFEMRLNEERARRQDQGKIQDRTGPKPPTP